MQMLLDRIRKDGEYIGDGIVKLDSFLNHQVDAKLTYKMGEEFVRRFNELSIRGITKIVTAEVSGIPAALIAAYILDVPLVFARKHQSAVMTDVYYMAQARSRTKGNETNLMVSKKYLNDTDQVVIIDDFLATGSTLAALCSLVVESGAQLRGIGCIIEKPQEEGRGKLAHLDVPIVTLARINWQGNELQLSE